jgi:hypothetical protein
VEWNPSPCEKIGSVIIGYIVYSVFAYNVFAPVYWYRLYRNMKRALPLDEPIADR